MDFFFYLPLMKVYVINITNCTKKKEFKLSKLKLACSDAK